jgi:hypothetical protein
MKDLTPNQVLEALARLAPKILSNLRERAEQAERERDEARRQLCAVQADQVAATGSLVAVLWGHEVADQLYPSEGGSVEQAASDAVTVPIEIGNEGEP